LTSDIITAKAATIPQKRTISVTVCPKLDNAKVSCRPRTVQIVKPYFWRCYPLSYFLPFIKFTLCIALICGDRSRRDAASFNWLTSLWTLYYSIFVRIGNL